MILGVSYLLSTLEQAIQIVQDLDQPQVFSFPRCIYYRDNTHKIITVKSQPSRS